jgi:hypothetical protein
MYLFDPVHPLAAKSAAVMLPDDKEVRFPSSCQQDHGSTKQCETAFCDCRDGGA